MNNPTGFHHFATWLKVDQIDWRHPSLIVDTEVWLQDDPMRHSITLLSLIFAWTALSGLYLQVSHHFAAWSKVDQVDWRHPSLIVDTEVWLQHDPMRHSVTL